MGAMYSGTTFTFLLLLGATVGSAMNELCQLTSGSASGLAVAECKDAKWLALRLGACSNRVMTKTDAIKLFGSRSACADAVGITPQGVSAWPEELPRRIEDRVIAAVVRMPKKRVRKAKAVAA